MTPLVSKASTPQRCCRDYSKETIISCQRLAARRNNGAKPEGDGTPTVTSGQYGRRGIYVSAASDFQDGGIVALRELSDRFIPSSSSFLRCLHLR